MSSRSVVLCKVNYCDTNYLFKHWFRNSWSVMPWLLYVFSVMISLNLFKKKPFGLFPISKFNLPLKFFHVRFLPSGFKNDNLPLVDFSWTITWSGKWESHQSHSKAAELVPIGIWFDTINNIISISCPLFQSYWHQQQDEEQVYALIGWLNDYIHTGLVSNRVHFRFLSLWVLYFLFSLSGT